PTLIPAALPLFAGGPGVIGVLGWRRKRKTADVAVASTRVAGKSSVGKSAASQSTIRIPVTVVDHGIDATTATGRRSAGGSGRARSNRNAVRGPYILVRLHRAICRW